MADGTTLVAGGNAVGTCPAGGNATVDVGSMYDEIPPAGRTATFKTPLCRWNTTQLKILDLIDVKNLLDVSWTTIIVVF